MIAWLRRLIGCYKSIERYDLDEINSRSLKPGDVYVFSEDDGEASRLLVTQSNRDPWVNVPEGMFLSVYLASGDFRIMRRGAETVYRIRRY